MNELSNTITLKRIYSTHCQVCGTPHDPIAIVYFIPLDNNLVCLACANESELLYGESPIKPYKHTYEPRIYKEGE